ncbi:MAG: class I SAM-dependent methyltransferase [Patescibacteria group bacterium]|nr:class I SAM-dependent methyltransferase [Patescibacteria group bacterium]
MSQDPEFWKKYHLENDKPSMFSDKINEAIKDLDIKSVLEIGCGLGNNLKNFKGMKVTGIDLSEHAIKIARERFPNFSFYVGNILKIPLQETFDLVFTSGVVEHITPNILDQAFEEMFRVSNRYILNVEAYDKTEHEIKWHRGDNEFWTVHMAERWQRFNVKILSDYDIHKEYRLTLVSKL